MTPRQLAEMDSWRIIEALKWQLEQHRVPTLPSHHLRLSLQVDDLLLLAEIRPGVVCVRDRSRPHAHTLTPEEPPPPQLLTIILWRGV